MKPHHRSTALILAVALLGTAGLLGISRWQQEPRAPANAPPAPEKTAEGVFGELPKASDLAGGQDGRMTAKVSQRPSPADTTPGIDRTADQPRPGEMVYRLDALPTACGTYWVENDDGTFSRLGVCHPENHPGGSH
jgi:hypothetical protein